MKYLDPYHAMLDRAPRFRAVIRVAGGIAFVLLLMLDPAPECPLTLVFAVYGALVGVLLLAAFSWEV